MSFSSSSLSLFFVCISIFTSSLPMEKEISPAQQSAQLQKINQTAPILSALNEINALIINHYLWGHVEKLENVINEVEDFAKNYPIYPQRLLKERIYCKRNKEIALTMSRLNNLLGTSREFSTIIIKNPHIGSALRWYISQIANPKHPKIDYDNATVDISKLWYKDRRAEHDKLMRAALLMTYHFVDQDKSKAKLQWLYNFDYYTQVLRSPIPISKKCAIARALEKINCKTTMEMAFQSGQCAFCNLRDLYFHTRATPELVQIALNQGANPNEMMELRSCQHHTEDGDDTYGLVKQMPLTHIEAFLDDKKEAKMWLEFAEEDARKKKITLEKSEFYKQYQNHIEEYAK